MLYQHQGCMPSALYGIMHEQGSTLTILKNFRLDINEFAGSLLLKLWNFN